MDFNKIAQDMMELQTKLEVYEIRNKKIKELLTYQVKETMKLEKKLQNEKDELNKLILKIKLLSARETIKKIESIYIESANERDLKKEEVDNDKV